MSMYFYPFPNKSHALFIYHNSCLLAASNTFQKQKGRELVSLI
jgi:hypothetical protein